MSDRFTLGAPLSSEREDDVDLALRVREEMRAAVSNVRAGASAVDDVPQDADRSAEHEPGDGM
ncbi:MAG: hypothetical protein V7607_2341 [Solirubrobacteraceae bacterium]